MRGDELISLHKGCPACNKSDFTEHIHGIKEVTKWSDGYIISTTTTYTKDDPETYVVCDNCGKKFDDFAF